MLTYNMEGRGGAPLYEHLYRCIRQDILSGALAAGEKLPSRRRLAEHLNVSVMTVEGAYGQLEAEGYLIARPRRGFFVAAVEKRAEPQVSPSFPAAEEKLRTWRLDLASNRVDGRRFPVATWARLVRQALSEERETLMAPLPHQGLLELRAAIARDLARRRGLTVAPEQIVVGAGAEYLYLLLSQLLGRETVFAVEDPGYPKIRQVYRACGVTVEPIPLDSEGVDMKALYASHARVAHLSPAHQYPTGLVTTIGRRQALLKWAREREGYLIEDDYDSEFRFSGRPIPALQPIDREGRVIYMNTFPRPSPPPCVWALWCCRGGCWKPIGKSWAFMPVPSRRWSSRCFPGFLPGAFMNSTWPGCARSSACGAARCFRPFAQAPCPTASGSRRRGCISCWKWKQRHRRSS